MGKLAAPHARPSAARPLRSDVDPLVERTATHWYWLGEFTDDPLGDCAPAYRSFSVVRLLWEWEHGRDGRRLVLENTCGVYACVNLAHWRRRGAPAVARVLPAGQGAWPARGSAGCFVTHVSRADTSHAACGARVSVFDAAPGVITCRACVKSWVSGGGLLVDGPPGDVPGDAP